jgi:hypothetical protein
LEGRQVRQTHGVDGSDHDLAGDRSGRTLPYADFIHKRIELANDTAKSVEELLAFCGENERTFGAIDQFHTEEFFQVLHALARGTLGHSVLNGRLGETPFSDDIEEDF